MQIEGHDSRKSTRESKNAVGTRQICSGTGLNQEQSLQRPGDTRWCSHYKTLKSLNSLFRSVIEVLEYVEKHGPMSWTEALDAPVRQVLEASGYPLRTGHASEPGG